jgi:hypothetical protein
MPGRHFFRDEFASYPRVIYYFLHFPYF